jgi:hypothetical protein
METENKRDAMLTDHMDADSGRFTAPDLLLVFEARQAVMARAKPRARNRVQLNVLWSYFRGHVRSYHVGFAMLLFTAGFFYYDNNVLNGNRSSELMQQRDEIFSNRSSTISVISSTMLTSIPTLRN